MQRTTLPPDEKIRVLRAFEVAAAQTPSGVDPEIKKQVTPRSIKQLPAAPPAGAWVPLHQPDAARAPQCSQFLLAHHLAKVLAYTGEPDVVGRILAIMPKGDEDQPGQIDLMYSLRVIDTGWTAAQKQQAIDWFAKASRWRGGSTFAGTSTTSSTRPSTPSARTRSRSPTRRRRCSRRSPRTWRGARRPIRPRRGRGGGRGRGPQVPARPPGALRQPRVPARRRPGVAGRPRRRAQRGGRRRRVP